MTLTFSLSIPTQACPWWAPHWMSKLFLLNPSWKQNTSYSAFFNPQTRPFPGLNSLLLLRSVAPSKTHSQLLNPWETLLLLTAWIPIPPSIKIFFSLLVDFLSKMLPPTPAPTPITPPLMPPMPNLTNLLILFWRTTFSSSSSNSWQLRLCIFPWRPNLPRK